MDKTMLDYIRNIPSNIIKFKLFIPLDQVYNPGFNFGEQQTGSTRLRL